MEILVCTARKYDSFLRKKKCRILGSLDACMREKPDFAIITNETSFHVKTAIKLAKAGIHLFIEKPLSDSINGSRNLVNETKKRKLITMIACNFRFHPCLRKIKEIISKKEIGKILSIQVENGSFLPDWHPYEKYQQSYAANRELGGGVVLTCIHEIDYLYWFFGDVKEVFSITGKFSDLDISVEDLSAILLRFKNNVIAEIHLDYFQQPSYRGCKVIGTKGTLLWDIHTNVVRLYDVRKKRWIEKLKLPLYDMNLMYVDELLHFLNCVNKRKKSINDVEEGIRILNIALAVKKSSKIKKVIVPEK